MSVWYSIAVVGLFHIPQWDRRQRWLHWEYVAGMQSWVAPLSSFHLHPCQELQAYLSPALLSEQYSDSHSSQWFQVLSDGTHTRFEIWLRMLNAECNIEKRQTTSVIYNPYMHRIRNRQTCNNISFTPTDDLFSLAWSFYKDLCSLRSRLIPPVFQLFAAVNCKQDRTSAQIDQETWGWLLLYPDKSALTWLLY